MTSARGVRWGLLSFLIVLLSFTATQALAETKQASVGNYWFEDDARRDRTKIVVNQGDQLTFTIREGIYPAHTVDVDELGIHSPDLLLGSTYTTPQLNIAGTFRLYCRPHEQRGHVTTLFVRQTTPTTAAPQPDPRRQAETSAPPATAGSGPEPVAEGPPSSTPPPPATTPAPQPATPAPQPATPAPQPATPAGRRASPAAQPGTVAPPPATPAPTPATPAPGPDAPLSPPSDDAAPLTTLTPVGVGRADPESLARVPEPEPGSLDDLIGRREPRGAVPWTRALWLLMVAAVPILGAAGYALSREAGRHPR